MKALSSRMRFLFQRVGCAPRLLGSQPSRCGRNGWGDCSSRCPPLPLLLLPPIPPPPPPSTSRSASSSMHLVSFASRRGVQILITSPTLKGLGAMLDHAPPIYCEWHEKLSGDRQIRHCCQSNRPVNGRIRRECTGGGDTDDLGIMMIVIRVGTRMMAGAHCDRQHGVAINVDRCGTLLRDL